jgi:uncharacterized protein (DUF1778 family)
MTDIILKFPNSKRRLTPAEESVVRKCANRMHILYKDNNPFVTDEARQHAAEKLLRECIKTIFELNEEK